MKTKLTILFICFWAWSFAQDQKPDSMIGLPTNSPKNDMTLLKHVEGDTFVRLRDDDTEAETVVFQRDENGKVVRYVQHNQFTEKK